MQTHFCVILQLKRAGENATNTKRQDAKEKKMEKKIEFRKWWESLPQ